MDSVLVPTLRLQKVLVGFSGRNTFLESIWSRAKALQGER